MRVVLVAGPPCAGKSTYVAEHRGPDDVVIDFDAIAHALGYPADHVAWPADAHPARTVALRARASALRAAADDTGSHTVWLVSTIPDYTPARVEVSERVLLDPGKDECLSRAGDRPNLGGVRRQIDAWYDTYSLDLDAPSRSW